MSTQVDHALRLLLGFVVIPIWICAGFADYFCHRASNIAQTSGTRESVLHLAQFASVGLPLMAGLLFQINAGVLAAMLTFIFLHHAIAYADLRYANATRLIRPREQMIHSFLELLPLTSFLMVGALHFAQLLALFGLTADTAEFVIRWRPQPFGYIAGVFCAALVFNLLPYSEELTRCLKYTSSQLQ